MNGLDGLSYVLFVRRAARFVLEHLECRLHFLVLERNPYSVLLAYEAAWQDLSEVGFERIGPITVIQLLAAQCVSQEFAQTPESRNLRIVRGQLINRCDSNHVA